MTKYDKEIKELQALALEAKKYFPITEEIERGGSITYSHGTLDLDTPQAIISLKYRGEYKFSHELMLF